MAGQWLDDAVLYGVYPQSFADSDGPVHLGQRSCLYYGDEIGMRYLPGMPDVEGTVCNPAYHRAGW